MDWKKEIRVSDLFRKENGGAETPAAAPTAAPAGARKAAEDSIWKREIRIGGLFRRKRNRQQAPLALPAAGDTIAEAPDAAAVAPPEPAPDDATAQPGDGEAVAVAAAAAARTETSGEDEPREGAGGTEAAGPAEEDAADAPPGDVEAEPVAAATADEPGKRHPISFLGSRREGGAPEQEQAAARQSSRGKLPEVPIMRALNLLPADVKLAKTTVRPAFQYLAVAAAALLGVAGMGFLYYTKQQDIQAHESDVENLKAQIAAIETIEPAGDDNNVLAGEALARATALSTALDDRIAWDRILRGLSLTLPEEVWFESMTSAAPTPVPGEDGIPVATTSTRASSLTIQGYAMEQAGIAELLSRLEAVPDFSSIQLLSATRVLIDEVPVIQFSVAGALK